MSFGTEPPSPGSAPSPLAGAALGLMDAGLSARGLADAFANAGAHVSLEAAADLLGELARLGLVRVARRNGDGPVHVLTSLGRQVRDAGPGQVGAIADQLAELERLRTDLLSTIAHELRTPLTAVRTCIGILRDPEARPSATELDTLLSTIERNADRMQRMVGDILEITRFRTGQVLLQLRPFDALELARVAVASVEPLAVQRHQRIELQLPVDPLRVYGDHRRLEQALVNLISNAVKYGPAEGTIAIAVSAPAGGWAAWSVRDDGPGIASEDQTHLFERFFVGPNDRGPGPRGVGLGLPTALAIAQAHGGRIEVDSTLGEGSRFTLVVPRDGPPDTD